MNKPRSDVNSKGGYAPASLAKLLAVAGKSGNEPVRIALTDIDEDPGQPRKGIEPDGLEPLATTIRSHGVLQPIGVYPLVDGRYQLAFGARRVRASRLAGKLDIPAVIIAEGQRNFASQVIENQQRANLSNSDLAAAIIQLQAEGASAGDIAVICNLKEYQVTAYRAVAKFPEFLSKRVDSADVRGLYDLYRQWTKTPIEIEAQMPTGDDFITVTEARRIIEAVAGVSTSSIFLPSRSDAVEEKSKQSIGTREADQIGPDADPDKILHGAELSTRPVERPATADTPESKPEVNDKAEPKVPTFIVAIGNGEHGQLVVDRQGKAAGWALVRFPTGIEEVEFTTLRTVAIE